MLAAAAAWEGLAATMDHAAVSYGSTIAELIGDAWLGPAAAAMAVAATKCIEWLSSAAAQAEQAANQARDAATAFETAFAMTVPPSLIVANRTQLLALVATNFVGQNSPAIEANEAAYAEMWAQDAAAMYGYEGASAAASALATFDQQLDQPPVAGPAESAEKSQALPTATGASAETNGQTGVGQFVSDFLQEVNTLAVSPAEIPDLLPDDVVKIPTLIGDLEVTSAYMMATSTVGMSMSLVNTAKLWGFGGGANGLWGSGVSDVQSSHADAAGVLVSMPSMPTGTTMAADVGRAAMVGSLSVPHGWTMAAPEIKLAVEALPALGLSGAPLDVSGAPTGLLSGMALASLAGRGLGGAGSRIVSGTGAREDNNECQPQRKATVVVIQQQKRSP
jgi:PPE-repeat protein